MSVKNEYRNLLEESKMKTVKLEAKKVYISDLRSKLDKLMERKASLSTRTSQLAKTVQDEVAQEIQSMQQSIAEAEKEYEDIRKALSTMKGQIKELEDNPTRYIEEQSTAMAKEFVDYVHKNELDFARNMDTRFAIAIVATTKMMRYEEYSNPTGNICIRANKKKITTSAEFYFKKDLANAKYNGNDECVYVHYTEWFESYLEQFYKTLKEKLTEAFRDNENFTVVFTEQEDEFIVKLI